MKKLFSALLISVILTTLFCGCSNESDENITINTTTSATETTATTAISTTEPATELATETTTDTIIEQTAVDTTKMQTTTAATTKKETATQKPTTTKSTTTKKETATKAKVKYCDEGGSHHRLDDGQIGWYETFDEAMVAKVQYCKNHPNVKYVLIEQCACRLFTVTPVPTPTASPYYCFDGGIHHGRSVGPVGWYNSYNEALEAMGQYIDKHPLYTNYIIEACDCSLWTANFSIAGVPDLEDHLHVWDSGKVTTKPTCIKEGVKTYTCIICGETITESIYFIDHNYEPTVIPPTCTEQGITIYTCSMCGKSYEGSNILPTGHNYKYVSSNNGTHNKVCKVCKDTVKENCTWDSGKITTNSSCTQEGEKIYTCTLCGGTKTEKIKKTNHNYESVLIPSTCTEQGKTVYICSKCGKSYEDNYSAPLGHYYHYVAGSDGSHKKICNVCGDTVKESCTWNGGRITGDERVYVCLVCGGTKTEKIE